jgi:hypothetical protein
MRMTMSSDADHRDRTALITLITPLRRGGVLWLRVFFAISRRFPQILQIAPMKAVHFTYWSLVTRIPYNGPPQLPERPKRPWLVWHSVFNAAMDPYVEAFVAAVAPQVNVTWKFAERFPGTGSVTRLINYIRAYSWAGSHSYSAYPDATVRAILSAKTVQREHRLLEQAAASASPAEFAETYRGFLARCQGDL